MERFKDKVALITGAGSGIGLATAQRLGAEGASVIAGIVDENQRAAVAGLEPVILDVRAEGDWERVIGAVQTGHGGLDVLVNCAGIHRPGGALETSQAVWDEVMAVNLWGSFQGCRAAIPALRRRGGGAIVNLASIAAITGVPGELAYAASKGGVLTMTMALAIELAGERIRVNCVCRPRSTPRFWTRSSPGRPIRRRSGARLRPSIRWSGSEASRRSPRRSPSSRATTHPS